LTPLQEQSFPGGRYRLGEYTLQYLIHRCRQKSNDGLDKLPADIDNWSKWLIYEYPESEVLLIKVPDAAGQEEPYKSIPVTLKGYP